jgi:hypothetical protein
MLLGPARNDQAVVVVVVTAAAQVAQVVVDRVVSDPVAATVDGTTKSTM